MPCAALTLALAACGGTAGGADAGTDAPALRDAGPTLAPASPNIPWLADGVPPIAPPTFTPCPEGWREVTDESGPTRCDPYPSEGARTDCPEGQAHFPGEPSCAPISGECAADGWPAGGGEPTLHVRAGAAPGGDGSRAAPLATIADALARAAEGSVIAIASGTYEEVLRITSRVTLRGACASGTRIEASAPSGTSATVEIAADGVALEALVIAAATSGAVDVDGTAATASVTLRGVAGARRAPVRPARARAAQAPRWSSSARSSRTSRPPAWGLPR
ncbi:MAG: DUF1565 domain-containing protein [Sandaracinaceae bacterium]|nr:DUF1565 domain-containing protein [Sandaracinaceae bacterium]